VVETAVLSSASFNYSNRRLIAVIPNYIDVLMLASVIACFALSYEL
jgi:hypothetical protein